MSFVIYGDTVCDMNQEMRERYGIEYVKMNYCIDGKEYPASLDWESHSAKEFYDMMRAGTVVTTTQVPRHLYEEAFEACCKEGKDVVYVACSSALSGSINTATVVAAELKEKYPERSIRCVDSLISSLGQAGLLIKASEMRAEGKTADETADWLEANRLKVNQVGTVDDLKYLSRAGRVKASSAFFGNIFGVKPLIISDIAGQNFAVKKAKGALNAKKEMTQMIAGWVENPEEQTLYISHADDEASAKQFADEIMKVVPFKDCVLSYIAPIVGASVGPGTIISFCYGKEVTVKGE